MRRKTEKPNASNVAGTRNGGRLRRIVLRTIPATDSGVARDDFIKKVDNILDYVSKDELIKDCDQNPVVKVDIEAILTKSLNALKQAV